MGGVGEVDGGVELEDNALYWIRINTMATKFVGPT
jgi:hypothetical protein